MLACTIRRRSVVQRWPAVPTAAKTIRRAASRGRAGHHDHGVVAAELQQAAARRCATPPRRRGPWRSSRWRDERARAASSPAARHLRAPRRRRAVRPAGGANSSSALQQVVAGERGQRGFSEGFQTTASPQTRASAGVPGPHGHGKLKALMTPTTPSGVPGFHHAVAGALAGDGQAVQLARQAHGEVADVDHRAVRARSRPWPCQGPGQASCCKTVSKRVREETVMEGQKGVTKKGPGGEPQVWRA